LAVLHFPEIGGNLKRRVLFVDLDFGIFGYQHELLFPGYRIGGASEHITGSGHRRKPHEFASGQSTRIGYF
jgi:hypothetical protein